MPTAQPRGSPTVSLRRQSHHLTVTIKRDLRYRARGDGDTGHVAYSVTVEKATCPRDVGVRGNINNRPLGHSVQRCPPADNRLAGDTPEIRSHGNRFNCWTDKEQAARQKP